MQDRLIQLWNDHKARVIQIVGVALIAFTAFGFGRATAPMPQKAPLTVEPLPFSTQLNATAPPPLSVSTETHATVKLPQDNPAHNYVASKSGTKYYLPDCSGVKRIKEENKVWFTTEQEARVSQCPSFRDS